MIKSESEQIPINILSISTTAVNYIDYLGKQQTTDKLNISGNVKIKYKPNLSLQNIIDEPLTEGIPIAKFNMNEKFKVLGYVGNYLYLEQNEVKGWVLKE